MTTKLQLLDNTPLPWNYTHVIGDFGIIHAESGRVASIFYDNSVYAQREQAKACAEYVIKSANAYPRGIELLKYCSDHAGIGDPLKTAIQDYLRELGELQ